MSTILDLEKLFHRSKARIKDLGEVFTPEAYVEDMLNLLAKDKRGIWSDEDVTFFEPCSGHGNIVLQIFRKRLEAFHKKAASRGTNEAAFFAVANSINTLWAIDIDRKNIENCRSRVFAAAVDFLKAKLNVKSESALFAKNRDFFAHMVAAIKWHINENETLSALTPPEFAKSRASLTRAGAKWISSNGHRQLNFDLTWVTFYKQCVSNNTAPLQYERSLRFVETVISGRVRGFDEFDFAKSVISSDRLKAPSEGRPNRAISLGV